MSTSRFPDAKAQLSGQDGNAFNLLGITIRALRKAGATEAEIKQFQDEAMSGSYDELIQTCARWADVS